MKVNRYEVLFNFLSSEKVKEVDFYNEMLNKNEGDWNINKTLYEKSKETINKNQEFMNIDEYAYDKFRNLNGDTIIIGLSYNGDQERFNILGENNNMEKVYFVLSNQNFHW